MRVARSAVTGRFVTPKVGSRVRVSFGGHNTTGVITHKTVTGRYNVKIQVDGADEPITTSYARDEMQLIESEPGGDSAD